MSRGLALAVAAVALSASGCLDPIVGAECADGYAECDGACVDLGSDADHCGACGAVCAGTCIGGACSDPDGWSDPGGGGGGGGGDPADLGVDGAMCGRAETTCAGACVDLSADPDNCGGCGWQCASGLCQDGACLGQPPGQIVLLGHDFTRAVPGMRRLLGNAVFLAARREVRIAAYRGQVAAASREGIDRALDAGATAIGRSFSLTEVDGAGIAGGLAGFDVVLVYPQHSGVDSELVATGASWSGALAELLDHGGVVVLLDAPASHAGTFQLLAAAGVIDVSARDEVSAPAVTVVAPTDAVAVNVPLVYAVTDHTVWFTTTETDMVVADGSAPVVVHRLWP